MDRPYRYKFEKSGDINQRRLWVLSSQWHSLGLKILHPERQKLFNLHPKCLMTSLFTYTSKAVHYSWRTLVARICGQFSRTRGRVSDSVLVSVWDRGSITPGGDFGAASNINEWIMTSSVLQMSPLSVLHHLLENALSRVPLETYFRLQCNFFFIWGCFSWKLKTHIKAFINMKILRPVLTVKNTPCWVLLCLQNFEGNK